MDILRVQDIIRRRRIQRRILRDTSNPFNEEPKYFFSLYRLFPDAAMELCVMLAPHLPEGETDRAIPIHIQVLISLRLLGTGSYQKVSSLNYYHPTSQATVCRCFDRVINALVAESHRLIRFPCTKVEREEVQKEFKKDMKVDGILGIIDCVVVKILKPTRHEESYVNHKHSHALNVQVIADCKKIIRSIRVCPGSNSDKFVWNFSDVKKYMEHLWADPTIENNDCMTYHLIGDSGYNCSQIMLTPIRRPIPGSAEARYNNQLCKTRCKVENTFGRLSIIWRSVNRERGLRYSPEKAAKIVTAAAVLHNFRLNNGIIPPPPPDAKIYSDADPKIDENYADGLLIRQMILNKYYSS